MINVVLAGTYPAQTYEKLRAMLPADQFILTAVDNQKDYENMTDAEMIILRTFMAPREVIDRNLGLKMILRWGSGFDSVDIRAAGERGIPVINTPGANANAVSELAVMLMLAVGRKLLCHTECIKNDVWSKNTFLNQSYCLNQKLVGVVGGGNIGRQVASMVRAFGAKVQYYDPYRMSRDMEREYGMAYVPLVTLLETSDIITIHVPLSDSTKHMIGAAEIARMKTGAILVNTSRGGLVDDYALAEAVQSGKLAGAGLDCVEREPLGKEDKLLKDPNIIVTPHIGGGTADLGDIIIPMLAHDIQTFASGKIPDHTVNKKYLKGLPRTAP